MRPHAPSRRSHSQHSPPPSLAAAAQQHRSPASRRAKPGRPGARGEKAGWPPRDLRPSRLQGPRRQPSRGRALPGNFLSGCRRLRLRGRGASRPLLSPPFSSPLARLSPPSSARVLLPEGALASALLPSPREAQLLTNIIALLPPLWSPNNPFSTLRGRCSEERVLATQGLSEQGFLSRGRSCAGSPRPPRRPEHPPRPASPPPGAGDALED